jgi:ribose transport system permease protein
MTMSTKNRSVPLKSIRLAQPPHGRHLHVGEYSWIWIGTALLFLISAYLAPGSVSLGALSAMLPFAGMFGIVAVGQTLVIQQRGIDLSAVGAIALSGILVSMLAKGMPLLLALLVTFAIGLLIGCAIGLLIARLNITPIVVTLAAGALLIGAVRQISGGTPITAPAALNHFATERLLQIPYSFFLAAAFVIVVAAVTRRMMYGRRFVAVGVNPESANAAGIIAQRYQIGAYAAAALCFSVTGVLLAGYIGTASHTAGNEYLLLGIAAVVVGGTPFTGGRGSVVASGIASIFMTQLGQLVLSIGASPATQLFVQAGIIVAVVGLRNIGSIQGPK